MKEMGLTERHWFEDEEPELTEQQLEDVLSIQDRFYRRGYQKGYYDRNKEIVRCKDCKHFEPDGIYTMCYRHNGLSQNADWFCADGERKEGR